MKTTKLIKELTDSVNDCVRKQPKILRKIKSLHTKIEKDARCIAYDFIKSLKDDTLFNNNDKAIHYPDGNWVKDLPYDFYLRSGKGKVAEGYMLYKYVEDDRVCVFAMDRTHSCVKYCCINTHSNGLFKIDEYFSDFGFVFEKYIDDAWEFLHKDQFIGKDGKCKYKQIFCDVALKQTLAEKHFYDTAFKDFLHDKNKKSKTKIK